MFSFFKKKTSSASSSWDVKPLTVDIHSHLIPSIDDGSQSIEESILLIKALMKQGYSKIITTPHIMFDSYRNTQKSILQGLNDLQREVSTQGLNIVIEAGAEYYLDEGLLPLIKRNELLLISNKYLLFETSYTHRPMQLEEIIFEILAAGYIPLLAHPERYRYIKNPKEEYTTLKKLGVEFQVNLNSFNGYYGSQSKKNALFLSKHGMIDFLGSDTHNMKQIENLSKIFKSPEYKEIYKFNIIKNEILG
jgi:tyrosine-protein phosphatase YwqE